jgi:hypothetical protein
MIVTGIFLSCNTSETNTTLHSKTTLLLIVESRFQDLKFGLQQMTRVNVNSNNLRNIITQDLGDAN